LAGLLLDGVSYGGLLLQHLVDDTTGLGNVGVIALYLGSAVGHAADRLVDHDGRVRLLHDFVDLVTLGPDQ
jgi:hypothetical protein